MNRKILTAMLVFSFAVAGYANAANIYKWTDEDGNVHYTDKPVDQSSEVVAISSRPTDNAQAMAQMQASLDRRSASQQAQNTVTAPSPEEAAVSKADRAQKCSMYKGRLTKYVQSRRLYREDEDGERVYLDETESQAAREKAESQVEEFCS